MGELTGVSIGITAERRAEEFIAALERHGAAVRHAPTIRIVPLPDDSLLRSATTSVLSAPVDFAAVTTGAGFRGWVEAASGWGLSEELLERLGESRLAVRGPKAKGAVRGLGLAEEWSAPGETNAELFSWLLEQGVAGKRVVVQLHGAPLPDLVDSLAVAGASVVEVQPYRWEWPVDLSPARGLIDAVIAGEVRVLAFTSAPAAANLLALAGDRVDELVSALRGGVLCACVGEVTAAPLTAVGVPTVQPDRPRLGALVKLLVREFSGSASQP